MSADKGKKMTLEDWNKFFQRIRPVIEKYKTALEEKLEELMLQWEEVQS